MLKSLNDCIEKSIRGKCTIEHDASFLTEVNGENWDCYTAAIGYREFTLYCNQGTATFFVDSYGDRNTCELIDWELEG